MKPPRDRTAWRRACWEAASAELEHAKNIYWERNARHAADMRARRILESMTKSPVVVPKDLREKIERYL
jgi:hypothetical protein